MYSARITTDFPEGCRYRLHIRTTKGNTAMKLAIIIYSNDAETVWNAFRLANTALDKDDEVTIFLLGKGVECVSINSIKYNIKQQIEIFNEYNGKMIGCGVCCDTRIDEMPLLRDDLQCEMGSMQTLYKIMRDSDKVVTF